MTLDYRLEAERFAGAKVARVTFKGTEEKDSIERPFTIREQGVQLCRPHIVYVIVSERDAEM